MSSETFGAMRRAVATGLAAGWMMAATGCLWLVVGAAAGGAAAVYYQGRLEQTLDANLDRCHRAAQRTLADLRLPILQDRADAVTAHVESEYADGKRVWIDLEAVGGATKVSVRVGLIGDKDRSLTILDRIKSHAGL